LEIIGDGLAHFEPDPHGVLVWEIVDYLISQFDLIRSRTLSKVSFKPPEGYSYIELFNPLNHNDILQTLGSNPCLQDILNINSDYHSNIKGFLWN
jgi:hypothetical protein